MRTREGWETANEILNRHFDPIDFGVDGVLAPGLTLLVARAKVGKSWLCLQWAKQMTYGGKLWGRDVRVGDVCYYSLEDNDRRINQRLKIQGWDAPVPDSMRFKYKFNLNEALDIIKAESPRALIIDPFNRAWGNVKSFDQDKGQDVTRALDALQKAAVNSKTNVILVHHMSKSRSDPSADLAEAGSGSIAFGTVADTIIGLYRPRSLSTAKLKVVGRDFPYVELDLRWNAAHGIWESEGEPEAAGDFMKVVRELGKERCTGKELSARLGMSKDKVSRLTSELQSLGMITASKNGDDARLTYFDLVREVEL